MVEWSNGFLLKKILELHTESIFIEVGCDGISRYRYKVSRFFDVLEEVYAATHTQTEVVPRIYNFRPQDYKSWRWKFFYLH